MSQLRYRQYIQLFEKTKIAVQRGQPLPPEFSAFVEELHNYRPTTTSQSSREHYEAFRSIVYEGSHATPQGMMRHLRELIDNYPATQEDLSQNIGDLALGAQLCIGLERSLEIKRKI